MTRRRLLAIAWACSCGAEPGPLDRDVVLDLSRTRGGATGTTWTGRYPVTVTAESCPCPPTGLQPLDWASLCGPASLPGDEITTEIDVVETDGLLLLRAPGTGSLTGPIEADGEFSVGAVVDLGSPVSDGSIVLRADGFFRSTAAPGPAARAIEATVRRRLVGELGDESTDCTEVVSVRLTQE